MGVIRFLFSVGLLCQSLSLAGQKVPSSNPQHWPIDSLLKSASSIQRTLPDSANRLFHQVLEQSERLNYPEGKVSALIGFGLAEYFQGNYEGAIDHYERAIAEARKYELFSEVGRCYFNISYIHQLSNRNTAAVKNLIEAAKQFEKANDTIGLIRINQNLGIIFRQLRQLEKALLHSNRAFRLAQAKGLISAAIENYHNQSLVMLEMGNLPEYKAILDSVNHMLDLIPDELSRKKMQNYVYAGYATYYRNVGDSDSMLYYAKKTVQILRQPDGSLRDECRAYINLGEAYLRMGRLDSAESKLSQAESIAETNGLAEFIPQLYSLIAQLAHKTEDYEEAFRYKSRAYAINDSLLRSENLVLLNSYSEQHELDLKDAELVASRLKIQEHENALLREESNRRVILYWSISILLLLILFVFLYRQRSQLKERQLAELRAHWKMEKMKAIMDGEENERLRLAGELHDNLNGDLAALHYRLDAIEESAQTEIQKEEVSKSKLFLAQIMHEIRKLAHVLAPPSHFKAGLAESVVQYCRLVSEHSSLRIDTHVLGEKVNLPPEMVSSLYRIIQELISNVQKHADATLVDLHLNQSEDELQITIEDNGKGFNPENTHWGFGLNSIQSRVEVLRGEFTIESNTWGSLFIIQVPFHQP